MTLLLFLLSASSCLAEFYWDAPYDDYKQNPINAENKWINMRLQFTSGNAIVSRIDKNIWGTPYIAVSNRDDENAKVEYVFYLKKHKGSYPQQLLDARVGQSIKISGVIYKLKETFFGLGDNIQVLLNDVQFIDGEM